MIDCYVMPIKSGKTRTLVERAVREIVDNESCVVYINLDDTREYVYQFACDLLQPNDEFDAVKNRFKYLNVPYGSFNINTLAEICKMFQYEADIVIVDGADAMFKNGENPYVRSIDSFVNCYHTISLLGEKYGKDFIFEFQDSANNTVYDDFLKSQNSVGYKVCNKKINISSLR